MNAPSNSLIERMPRAHRVLVSTLLLILACGVLVHLLKVVRVSVEIGALFFYATFPVAVVLSAMALMRFRPRAFALRGLSALLVVMMVLGAVGAAYNDAGVLDIAGDITRILFCLLFCLACTNRPEAYVTYVDQVIPRFSKIFMWVSFASAVVLYLVSGRGGSVYFGLQVTIALLPLAYGLVSRKNLYVILSLLAIVLAGKRGTMGAAIVMILVAVVIERRTELVVRSVLAAAVLFVTIYLSIIFDFMPDQVLNRFSEFTGGGDFDINRATAGRFYEIDAALAEFGRNKWILIVGKGLGASYEIDYAADSTVHLSPLSMILRYGIPLTLMFYGFLASIVLWGLRQRMTAQAGGMGVKIMLLVLVGEFVFSFSAFTLMQSYLLWISYCYLYSARMLRKGIR